MWLRPPVCCQRRLLHFRALAQGMAIAAQRPMKKPHLLVVGGGLAGLSAGCYALRSGYRVTVVEHNLALGGVCTAWPRGPYVVDGCIHWLTGGEYNRVYKELGILPAVRTRVLEQWVTYRDVAAGLSLPITADLDALFQRLAQLAPNDKEELQHLKQGARALAAMKQPLDAPELATLRKALESVWEMRGALESVVRFRKPVAVYAREHLSNPRLQRLLTRLVPPTAPTLFLLMVLGYLERGYLSRPEGGTGAFRDALEVSFRSLGGESILHATVDEILTESGRACGLRLADGTMLKADAVISTASAPETVLRLLGGRFDAEPTRQRMARWNMFEPIVLASFGVALPFEDLPPLLLLDAVQPLVVGGHVNDHLYLRICNDDPVFAPPGHTVVQAMLTTGYDWWATRGLHYGAEKDAVASDVLRALEPHLPGLQDAVRMTDVATPLTYWSMARSWRGAYEGWMPNTEAYFTHTSKKLHGLEGFCMAGQWVEPGGGVPTALLSGRQAVQLLCAADNRVFAALPEVSSADTPYVSEAASPHS